MGTYFKCPYFEYEGVHTITCEDTIRYLADKKKHIERHCASDHWAQCPHAKKINDQYDRKGDMTDKFKANAGQEEVRKLLARIGRMEAKTIKLEKENDALKHQAEVQREARLAAEQATHTEVTKRLLSESLLAYHLKSTNTFVIDPINATETMKTYKIRYKPQEDGKLQLVLDKRE